MNGRTIPVIAPHNPLLTTKWTNRTRRRRQCPKGLSGISRLLRIDEVIEHLNINRQQLARLIREQNLPCVKKDGELHFDPEQLDRWVERSRGHAGDHTGEMAQPEPFLFHEHRGRLALTVLDPEAASQSLPCMESVLLSISAAPQARAHVSKALQAGGEPTILCPLPGPLRSPFNVIITADRLKAYVFLSAGAASVRTINPHSLRARLMDMGVCYGLDDAVIQAIAHPGAPGKLLRVALGDPPSADGEPEIVCHFKTPPDFKPRDLESFTTDPNSDKRLTFVRMGDVLAEIKTPPNIKNGADVFGRTVTYTSWAAAALRSGPKTYASRQGLRLHASCSGIPYWKKQSVCVDPTRIFQNISGIAGIVPFDGRLIVRRHVKNAGAIDAKKKLIIQGRAENTSLVSRTSSINVIEGISGGGQATVQAAASIRTGFAENCTLRAGLDVLARFTISECDVRAGRRMIMKSDAAKILSSTIRCGQCMILENAGSPAGGAVTLIIEHVFDSQNGAEREHLQNAVLEARQVVRTIKGRMKRLTNPDTDAYKACEARIRAVQEITEKRERAYESFRRWLTDPDMIFIDIRGRAYPGVVIQIEDRKLRLHELYGNQRFYYTHGGIAHKPLKPEINE